LCAAEVARLPKDFVSIADWPREALLQIIERARELKRLRRERQRVLTLDGCSVVLYFEKPSLRTLVTFEVATAELGAHPVHLPPQSVQIGTREPAEDVARNLSRWCHAIVARTYAHEIVLSLARHSSVPVVNALTDELHPCQAVADAVTISEAGDLLRDRLVYIGDGNNMLHSLIHLAGALGTRLTFCTPEGYAPSREVVEWGTERARATGGDIRAERDPTAAVKDAAFVYTDVWASMGQEAQAEARRAVFAPYQINAALLRHAPADVRVLHCLPAHRGEEIAADVLESERALVFDQAENRLHAQKAILELLVAQQKS
jgi:ornithine carbamoyltransferase